LRNGYLSDFDDRVEWRAHDIRAGVRHYICCYANAATVATHIMKTLSLSQLNDRIESCSHHRQARNSVILIKFIIHIFSIFWLTRRSNTNTLYFFASQWSCHIVYTLILIISPLPFIIYMCFLLLRFYTFRLLRTLLFLSLLYCLIV
jgi:hypothetical protein